MKVGAYPELGHLVQHLCDCFGLPGVHRSSIPPIAQASAAEPVSSRDDVLFSLRGRSTDMPVRKNKPSSSRRRRFCSEVIALWAGSAFPDTRSCNMRAHSELDWGKWQKLVEEHQLGPVLHAYPPGDMPAGTSLEIAMLYNRNAGNALSREVELSSLVCGLNGVDTMILKGGAMTGYVYGEQALREMWDFDLLFQTQELGEAAQKKFLADGYRAGHKRPNHHHFSALVHSVRNTAIEIHTNLRTPPLPESFMAKFWETRVAVPGYEHLYVPNEMGALFHAAAHCMRDPVEAPLLRNLLEIAVLSNRLDSTLHQEFQHFADSSGIADYIARALWLAHEVFGSPPLFDRRSNEGFYEVWCRRRLRRYGGDHLFGRIVTHVSARHCDLLAAGAGNRNPLPIAPVTWKTLKDRWLSGLKNRSTSKAEVLARNDLLSSRLADRTLLLEPRSRNTHLLDHCSSRIWEELSVAMSADQLISQLQSQGITKAEVSTSLRAMRAKEIITRR